VEDAWVGRTASVGDRAVLEFTHRTERCVMVNNAQSELAQSKQVLRTVGAANDLSFGIYAKVIQTGTVQLGDELRLMA
jgi:MOSC domain-containing protein YiiM